MADHGLALVVRYYLSRAVSVSAKNQVEDFALTEASYMLVRMLQEYEEIKKSPNCTDVDGKMSEHVGIFLTCADGCQVVLTKADRNGAKS